MSTSVYGKYILPHLIHHAMKSEDIEKEREQLIPYATGVTVEIGFGSGLNLPFYKGVTKLYAVDPSNELWKLAEKGIKKASFPVEFIQTGAEKLPFRDQSINTVVSTWSLCSVTNPEKVLNEIRRVLKPTGKFILIEHGKSSKPYVAAWQVRLTPIWKIFAGGCHLDRDVVELLTQAGFQGVNLHREYEKRSRPKFLQYLYKGIVFREKRSNPHASNSPPK